MPRSQCNPPSAFTAHHWPGMWKNCQEASLQTEVMTHDSKGLPNQNTQRILAWFPPPSGILIIGVKKKFWYRCKADILVLGVKDILIPEVEKKLPFRRGFSPFWVRNQHELETLRNQFGTGQTSSIQSPDGEPPKRALTPVRSAK